MLLSTVSSLTLSTVCAAEARCQTKYNGYKATCKGFSCTAFAGAAGKTGGRKYKDWLTAQAAKARLCATQRQNWETDCNPRGYVVADHAGEIRAANAAATACDQYKSTASHQDLNAVP